MDMRKMMIRICEWILHRLDKRTVDAPLTNNEDKDDLRSDLETIRPGDVVWCQMPLSKKRLASIEESHRVRPYVIIEICSDTMKGYYCSSSPIQRVPSNEQFILRKENFFIKKDTYVNLHAPCTIPFSDFKAYYFSIDKETFSRIQLHLQQLETQCMHSIACVDCGTIIRHENQLYILYQVDHTHVYGSRLVPYIAGQAVQESDILLSLFERIYITDFTAVKTFDRQESLTIFTECSSEQYNEIKRLRERIKKRNKVEKDIPVSWQEAFTFSYTPGTRLYYSLHHTYLYFFTWRKHTYGVNIDDIQDTYVDTNIMVKRLPSMRPLVLGLSDKETYENALYRIHSHPEFEGVIAYLKSEYERMDAQGENIFCIPS